MNKFTLTVLLLLPLSCINAQTIQFTEDEKPIINPIKGFKGWNTSWGSPFDKNEVGLSSTMRLYIPLDSLIKKVNGGYEVINDLKLTHFVKTNNVESVSKEIYPDKLNTLFENNIKIIPRIVAHTDPGYKWFEDLNSSTYYKSQEFQDMLKFLIPKLVDKWDNDPNIAYVEMGLVGSYGEFVVEYLTYNEIYNEETLKILTEEFSKFKNKNVTTGGISGYIDKNSSKAFLEYIPSTILSNNFGISWDSFISMPQMEYYGWALEGNSTTWPITNVNKDLWQTKPYVGEVAYNYGDRLGDIPYDSNSSFTNLRLKQSIETTAMVDELVKGIKKYHTSDLAWISNYEKTPEAKIGAQRIHKALGYRFILKDASYEINSNQGENVDISFNISNAGSAPFYYKWPLVVSLIDKNFNVISNTETNIDITKWIEGDYSESVSIKVPTDIPNDQYYIAFSIQEQNRPAIRFANTNYFNGGYTPIGKLGVGKTISSGVIDASFFDDTDKDPKFNIAVPNIAPPVSKEKTASLNAGWNFVGINSNLTLAYLKNELENENLLDIKGADKVYKASDISAFNNFLKFEPGYGYWIKLNTLKEIKYTPKITNNTISLKKGWNIINPTSNLTFSQIKNQLGEENFEQLRGASKIYKRTNSLELNTFRAFKEPYGYWIKVQQDSLLRFWYQPDQNASWNIQLKGEINQRYDVNLYEIDLFDTTPSKIKELKDSGKSIICYVNAGAYENWRSDAGDFPTDILGEDMAGWEGEKWVDIRDEKLKPIMMSRLDLAQEKGCDGVEPDNVNSYTLQTGFNLTYNDQIKYNKWLADEAHKRNLSIGLKNNLDQIVDLEPFFDFAVNEQCLEYNECNKLKPFTDAGKPVFHIEYDLSLGIDNICEASKQNGFNTLILAKALDDSSRIVCE